MTSAIQEVNEILENVTCEKQKVQSEVLISASVTLRNKVKYM